MLMRFAGLVECGASRARRQASVAVCLVGALRRFPEFVALAFSPDGQQIASAGRGTLVKRWKVADGESVAVCGKSRRSQSRDGIRAVAFRADGAWLAAGDMAGFVHVFSRKK